jgi:hypothetical protein
MVETTQRFIREIADRVGLDNITEVHLFPPMRQGGVETGVAVIAAIVPDDDTIEKHTVFSAHYRNTIKGPDRGKWEVDVRAEADAPLATVDDVVRGVMKRAGEQFEPERLSAGEVRTVVTSDAA